VFKCKIRVKAKSSLVLWLLQGETFKNLFKYIVEVCSYSNASSGAVNNLARSTEPIGSRTKPLDAGPTTNPNALNSIVHEQDEAQLKSQEGQSDHSAARFVDFAYPVQSKVNHR